MFQQILKVDGPIAIKRLIYGLQGEPYSIAGHRLRFVPGTRPFRLKYADATNDDVARYDARQQLFMVDHLKPGHRAVDVGAHVGQDSLIMAALCGPDGEVTAFEPNREAREIFLRNVSLNPKVKSPKLIAAAVSNQDGKAILFNETGRSANSSLTPSGNRASGGYEVETVQLDTWMPAPPDLVKIDVEGFEIRVLEGASRLLDSPAIVLCELHPYAWSELGDSYEKLQSLLGRYGRRARYLDEAAEPTRIRYGVTVFEKR